MRLKISVILAIVATLLVSCNLPTLRSVTGDTSALSVEEISGTSVAATMAYKLTEIAGTQAAGADAGAAAPEPQAGPCSAQVTANVDANIRSGPSTAYSVVGLLPYGGTAPLAGRNSENTWWYIEFAGGSGGHAWIAGSVTTASCVPDALQVVAAPPLPVAPAVEEEPPPEEEEEPPPPAPEPKPDLVAADMQVAPNPAIKGVPLSVQVRVTNQGDAPSGNFSVQWWTSWAVVGCNWSVPSLAPGASKNLSCSYTYQGWSTYAIKEDVDPGNLVDESNEGNNTLEQQLQVKPN